MIGRDKKLRKISDSVFQEAEPPEDRSRPLEWRRNFNCVSLPLKNIKIVNSCTVHDTDFSLDEEQKANPIELVKPNVTEKNAITGILDEDQVRDSIYFAVENEEEEGIYSIERAQGETKITLKAGEPTEAKGKTSAGLYWGNAFRMNYEPGEDNLCFELSIPEKQISSLITSLREDSNSIVEIGAYLLSFTYEVDDALSEYYHPQDIVMNESTQCFVSWAGATSKIGQHYKQPDTEYEEETNDLNQEELSPEQQSHQELMRVLLSYSKPLNSLVTAVWVLIVIVCLYAFLS